MIVHAEWWGGPSYSFPDTRETFASITEAVDAFAWRLANVDGRTPCVTKDAEIRLFFGSADPMEQDYPDRIVTVGPRGGIRVERT